MAHRTPNRLNEVTPPTPRSLVARLASWIAYLVASQLVLALPVGSAQTIESSQNWKAAIAEIDQLASAELAKQNVGGCTIGIVVDGELVFAKSYGVADIEANTSATNDHVYRIGSITKQITGLMLLQLAESGDVRLSDPVRNYLPEIRNIKNRFERSPPITLIQLATMTSGLAREPDNLATHLQGPVRDWQKTLITALRDTRFRFEPDTQYHYSNVGYAILGAALSRAAEREFVDYVQEQILNPLQMHHTAFAPNGTIADAIAKGYTLRSGVPDATTSQREHAGRGYKVPNGALYTTVGDLAKFVVFELGNGPADVLPKEAVKRNFDRVNSSNGALSSGYGIGFGIFRHDDLTMIGHGGSVAGYNAAAYVHRPSQTGAIVLRNVGGGRFSAKDLCRRMLAVVAGCRSPRQLPPQEVHHTKTPKETLTLDGHEIYEGRRVLSDQESYPRQHATIVAGPTLQNKGGQTQIVFALDEFDDVLVRVVDTKGKTVENLGCGVLGVNAPAPFQKDRLLQVIPWKDAENSLRAGHRVQIKVGCEPHFDRFIAHDPNQLVKNICGMEVDHQGRLYVSFFTERRGDTEVRRYDRQGNLLDTVYPPSPQGLRSPLSDATRHVEKIDAQSAFPQRRGGWPFFIYKYHSKRENDPTQYPFPFRIAPDGNAYIAEVVSGRVGLTPDEIDLLPAVKARIFDVELDPFWFLKRMAMGSGVWAIGPKGYGYLCCTNQQAINELKSITLPSYKNEQFIGNTIVKVSLDTVEPVEDFQYSGTEKLSQNRAYIGTLKTKGQGPNFLNSVRDLTIDEDGTMYVVDENRIKVFRANGQFIDTLDQFEIDGKIQSLGDVHGIRAAGDSLYVVGRLDPIIEFNDKDERRGISTAEIQAYKKSVLVKFKISERASPQAVCSIALHGLANVIAVDRSDSTPIVWVGNGGGEASFTRLEDHGQSLVNVTHRLLARAT